MLLELLTGGKNAFVSLLFCLPIILFSLSFHEASHGYVAYRLGDPTARNLGRLTLNPAKHLDPLGFLAMLLVGFGWAKPVPINARHFKNPRVGMALTGLAGPVSNLLLAVLNCLLYALSNVGYAVVTLKGGSETLLTFLFWSTTFFYLAAYLNFSLMAFNLIPIPPFDGSRFAYLLLPPSWYFKVMKYEQTILIVVLVACLALSRLGFSPVSFVAGGLFRLIGDAFNRLFFKLATFLL